MFKHLTTPSPLWNRSLSTTPNPKIKGLTKAKVRERVAMTRATTAMIGGRKSHLTTKAGKANRRTRRSHQSLEAHASYEMAITGYTTVRRRSRLILLRPNSRATLQHPLKNPPFIEFCLGLILNAILKIKKREFFVKHVANLEHEGNELIDVVVDTTRLFELM